MNYMKEVANMLGVELGEEFELKRDISDICRYKLTADGLVAFSPITKDWHEGNKLLVDLLLGSNEIVKIPILDEAEKEYLSAVIKPFKDRVTWIAKFRYIIDMYDKTFHYIKINLKSCDGTRNTDIDLPYFEKGTIYKGMEKGKKYSLEELGL